MKITLLKQETVEYTAIIETTIIEPYAAYMAPPESENRSSQALSSRPTHVYRVETSYRSNKATIFSIRSEELQETFNFLALGLDSEIFVRHECSGNIRRPYEFNSTQCLLPEFKIVILDDIELAENSSVITTPNAFDMSRNLVSNLASNKAYMQVHINDNIECSLSFPYECLTIGNAGVWQYRAQQEILALGKDVIKCVMRQRLGNEKVDAIFGNHDITEPLEVDMQDLAGAQIVDIHLDTI